MSRPKFINCLSSTNPGFRACYIFAKIPWLLSLCDECSKTNEVHFALTERERDKTDFSGRKYATKTHQEQCHFMPPNALLDLSISQEYKVAGMLGLKTKPCPSNCDPTQEVNFSAASSEQVVAAAGAFPFGQ